MLTVEGIKKSSKGTVTFQRWARKGQNEVTPERCLSRKETGSRKRLPGLCPCCLAHGPQNSSLPTSWQPFYSSSMPCFSEGTECVIAASVQTSDTLGSQHQHQHRHRHHHNNTPSASVTASHQHQHRHQHQNRAMLLYWALSLLSFHPMHLQKCLCFISP